jgi:hypothetical protein
MTLNGWHAWRPQEPRPDFSERTVAAILRDRREIRRPLRERRWIITVAMAAAIVVAGAWAWAALPRTSSTRVSLPIPAPATASVARQSPAAVRMPPLPEPSIDPVVRSTAAPSAPPARHKDVSPPDRKPRANIPRCSCVPTVCDCVEEQ